MKSCGLNLWQWYRILRQHNHFSPWQALTFALWLARPHQVRKVHVGNGYNVRAIR